MNKRWKNQGWIFMRIKRVSVFTIKNNLEGKVWNPKIRWLVKYSVLVEIETENGLKGLGECWCFDSQPDALITFFRTEVISKFEGALTQERDAICRDLLDSTTLSARHGIMYSVVSGIDIALWDIEAQSKDLPLYQLLGGRTGEVNLYASGGLYGENKSTDDLTTELSGYVKAGFECVKMKVGGMEIKEDTKRVRSVRDALGPDIGIILDGVYSYTTEDAVRMFDSVRDFKISAFQSPITLSEGEKMANLVNEHNIPVMGIEAEYRDEILMTLINSGSVSILQIALVACGGLSAGLRLCNKAANYDLPCSLEVSSTAVAELAAFHLAAAHPSVLNVEFHMVHQVMFDQFPFSLNDIQGGLLRLPDKPGLGITLQYDKVEQVI